MVLACFIEPGDQVIAAGTCRAAAHAELACELRLPGRSQRGAFLVSHADPLDRLLAPHRVGERIERIAHDAKNLTDSYPGKCFDENVGNGLSHGSLLL